MGKLVWSQPQVRKWPTRRSNFQGNSSLWLALVATGTLCSHDVCLLYTPFVSSSACLTFPAIFDLKHLGVESIRLAPRSLPLRFYYWFIFNRNSGSGNGNTTRTQEALGLSRSRKALFTVCVLTHSHTHTHTHTDTLTKYRRPLMRALAWAKAGLAGRPCELDRISSVN